MKKTEQDQLKALLAERAEQVLSRAEDDAQKKQKIVK